MKMNIYQVCLALTFCFGAVLGSTCVWHPSAFTTDTAYCAWGCCYSYIYPCCSIPFYSDTPFIVGISVSCGIVFLAAIAGVCIRQRRRVVTSVQYTSPGTQNVFTTTTSTSAYNNSIGNTNYVRTY